MFKTIIYPTDFSPLGNAALPYAVLLASAFRGRLILLHVMLGDRRKLPAHLKVRAGCVEELKRLAAHSLHQLAPRLPIALTRVVYRVEEEHDAVRTILKEAALPGARLVVMATRGHGGIAGRLLGSVSSSVVRNAKCPVIAVRLPPGVPHERIPMRLRLRRILLPTDLSAVSARVFPIAAAIAGPFQSRLTALHVTQEDDKEKALAKLEKFVASHHRSEVPLSFQVRQGEPAKEILTHALHFNFDLIAMTTQGTHRLRDRLFGSTAERVLRASTRPVLIVK